jgi:hypothetical protein
MPALPYGPDLRLVIGHAQGVAVEWGSTSVFPQHLAQALMKHPKGGHVKVLSKIQFPVHEFLDRNWRAYETAGVQIHGVERIPFEDSVKELLTRTEAVASSMGASAVGTEHLLLAFLRGSHPVSDLLHTMGLHYDETENRILSLKGDPISKVHTYNYDLLLYSSLPDFDSGFSLLLDPGEASAELLGEVLDSISELNKAVGGQGLIFVDCPDHASVPCASI